MSKSLGNYIGIAEAPKEMYGKIMSIPDSLILDYFELVTDVPDEEIAEFREQLDTQAINPMTLKKRLAREIITQFHGKQDAAEAEEDFTKVFQKRELPEDIPEYTFAASYTQDGLYQLNIAPTLVQEGIVRSNSELKRLLGQGAVELDGEKISTNIINARNGSILKVGKHNFVRIMIK
jgi:tyrosyl-tRNA synthetase